jgi:hypothetical protein
MWLGNNYMFLVELVMLDIAMSSMRLEIDLLSVSILDIVV